MLTSWLLLALLAAAKLLAELPVSCILKQLKLYAKKTFLLLCFAAKLVAELPVSCIFPLVFGGMAAPILRFMLLLLLLLLAALFCSQAAG
jgi:hypothetical protein